MSIEKIIKAVSGKNLNGSHKTSLTIDYSIHNVENEDFEIIDSLSLKNSIINIEQRLPFLQVDISFEDHLDPELTSLWSMFGGYRKAVNILDENFQSYPVLSMSLAPIHNETKCKIEISEPILWVLQPEAPGYHANTIRVLYHFDDAHFYDDEGNEITDVEDDESQVEEVLSEELIDEILNASCGASEDGLSKAAVSIANEVYSINDNDANNDDDSGYDVKEGPSHSCFGPIVNIEWHGTFVQVDLIFKTYMDPEIKLLWNLLERYGKENNKFNENADSFPVLGMTIVPVSLQGLYSIVTRNPVFWVLVPDSQSPEANVLRILFNYTEIKFCKVNGIETDVIDKEIEREAAAAEAFVNLQEQKRQEESEYQDKRNAMLEEMRRNRINS